MAPDRQPANTDRVALVRAYNHAILSLDILFDLAEQGSVAAKVFLVAIAEKAAETAGKMQTFWDRD